MTSNPQKYVGEWWVPAHVDHNLSILSPNPEELFGQEKKYTGVLTYIGGENDIELELFIVSSKLPSTFFHFNQVMWGSSLDGNIFTLFGAGVKSYEMGNFTRYTYKVRYVIIGEHVLDPVEKRFGECIVEFPFLRKWAFRNNVIHNNNTNGEQCYAVADVSKQDYLLETTVEENVKWILRSCVQQKISYPGDLNIIQNTDFMILGKQGLSFEDCIQHIKRFRQFLSIALYCEQNPVEIELVNKKDSRRKKSKVLFSVEKSEDPGMMSLIKYNEMKEKLPSVILAWNNNFERVSPIIRNLLQSIRGKNVFDVPDFLIVAHALDGYYKRFVSKKNGKGRCKYEDGIRFLLTQFANINVVRRCNIVPKAIADARNFYSHLYPDEEYQGIKVGNDLLWLTKKCQVLLTCCILDMMGLTIDEINMCCNSSPITNMMDASPLEFDN